MKSTTETRLLGEETVKTRNLGDESLDVVQDSDDSSKNQKAEDRVTISHARLMKRLSAIRREWELERKSRRK